MADDTGAQLEGWPRFGGLTPEDFAAAEREADAAVAEPATFLEQLADLVAGKVLLGLAEQLHPLLIDQKHADEFARIAKHGRYPMQAWMPIGNGGYVVSLVMESRGSGTLRLENLSHELIWEGQLHA